MKHIPSYLKFLNESEDAQKDIDALKKDILEIDDQVKIEEYPLDRKIIIKTDSIDTATELHKFILTNQREYLVKEVDTVDINDLKVTFKTPDEIKKEEDEAEQKIKDAEEEKNAMSGLGDMGDLGTGIDANVADLGTDEQKAKETKK